MEVSRAGIKLRLQKARLRSANGVIFNLSLSAMEEPPRGFAALLSGRSGLSSLSAVIEKLEKLHGNSAFLAARWDEEGALEPILALETERVMAVASAFKLYVLAAVLEDINSGDRHWDDRIYLDAESRSYPSSQMSSWPVGLPVTLATATTLMISTSDNTATDLLIHTLGREHIEAMLQEAGNSHPEQNIPLLTTAEMVKLKSRHSQLGKVYAGLSTEAKREFLEREVRTLPYDNVTFQGSVERIQEIEWFASPLDLANVFRYLLAHSRSGEGARIRDILSINPELPPDHSRWDYIGFKGGGEPGVINCSYLLHSRKDDKWYLVTGSWNDARYPLRASTFESLIRRAVELLPSY